MKLEKIYDKHYKKLILIPLALFIIAIIILSISQMTKGSVVNLDVNLKGGLEANINKEVNFNEVQDYLTNSFEDVSVRELKNPITGKTNGINIKVSNINEEQLRDVLSKKININFDDSNEYSVGFTEGDFATSTYKSLILVLIIGFILMGLVVFISFRTFIPSITVVSAALMDVIITMAIISITGIKLGEGGIVALLLIIAYSIDTDILLTTRMLKRKQDNMYVRMESSIKTGLTMTVTTIFALLAAYFIVFNPVLKQIFLIIIIACFIDILTTYLSNGSILVWYMKKKGLS